MLECVSDASTRASRSKRARRSASSANSSGSTLIATSRPRRESQGAKYLAHAPGAEKAEDLEMG